MKILMQPVDMVVHFYTDGLPRPIRLRIPDHEGQPLVIKIDQVFSKSMQSFGKDKWILYRCNCISDGLIRSIELKYECSSCRWFIYKF